MQLLVRNKVKDYSTWRSYFDADRDVAAEYGLTLAMLWRAANDPNEVHFLLDIEDVNRANAFMARPESQLIGEESGVIEGEFRYLEVVN